MRLQAGSFVVQVCAAVEVHMHSLVCSVWVQHLVVFPDNTPAGSGQEAAWCASCIGPPCGHACRTLGRMGLGTETSDSPAARSVYANSVLCRPGQETSVSSGPEVEDALAELGTH